MSSVAEVASPRVRARSIVASLSPAVGRTRWEWLGDSTLFVLAIVVWIETAIPATNPHLDDAWRLVDLTLGAIAVASLWWGRRYPVAVAILMIVPGAIAISAAVGALASVYRVGLLAPVRIAVLIASAHLLTALPYHAILPVPGMTWLSWLIVIPLLYALCLCLGLLGRARRQVIVGLRETAARDRERYEERLASARSDERQRIAREMHDVLAHRISLMSMHAGGLEFRATSATPPNSNELRDATRTIRQNAEAAVDDLRELLGLLRSDEELGTGAPQPTLADVPELVEEARAVGQQVDLHWNVGEGAWRASTERTAYRVVQESLTNARKHAPDASVHVSLAHHGGTLTVAIINAVPPGVTSADMDGVGNGLIGLDERVRIEGGHLQATVRDGEFVVRAILPVEAS